MKGFEIVVGVTGGIAVFKTAALVSQLVQAGAGVTVVMTESAESFVGPTTFAALTGRPVLRKVFEERESLGAHISTAENAHLMCVAPATANFLGKAANGIADDLLSTLYLSFAGPILLAPAMNTVMWEKPSVQRNLGQLLSDGVKTVGPDEGWLSCRRSGVGRMASPEAIFQAIRQTLDNTAAPIRD
jgi:phosphopantothenoylcysteine decarboxylase/phosphopantothenate--cysteine ligase